MKNPPKILNTGKLLIWLRKNENKLLENHRNDNYYSFLHWKYESLERNENMMQTELSLGQFIPVKDEKVLEEPEQTPKDKDWASVEYKGKLYPVALGESWIKACEQILFDVKIDGISNNDGETVFEYIGTDIDHTVATKDLTIGEWELQYKILEEMINQIDVKGTENYWSKVFKL